MEMLMLVMTVMVNVANGVQPPTACSLPTQSLERAVNIAALSTGVDRGILEALTRVESSEGRNLGRRGAWRTMKASRDVLPLQTLLRVHYPWTTLDEVCISAAASGGYGGGVGATQILPSTWMEIGGWTRSPSGDWKYALEDDIVRRTLRYPAAVPSNPWNPLHGVTATAILLQRYGVHTNPNRALGAYHAGPRNWNKDAGRRYSRKVLNNLIASKEIAMN